MSRPLRIYTAKEITSACEKKLGMHFGSGGERNAWYELNGKKLFRLSIPKVHRKKEFGHAVRKHVFEKVRLTPEEYDDFIKCPMTGHDYAALALERFGEA